VGSRTHCTHCQHVRHTLYDIVEFLNLLRLLSHCNMPFNIADTPQYIYAPSVPYDVRKFYPHPKDLKFIVVLRNPVDRALSSYWFKNSKRFTNDRTDKGTSFIEQFMLQTVYFTNI
jgi:hypothetical protein